MPELFHSFLILVVLSVKSQGVEAEYHLADFAETAYAHGPAAVGDYDLKVVGWHCILEVLVAEFAPVALEALDDLPPAKLAGEVEHGPLEGVDWDRDPRQLAVRLQVQRLSRKDFRVVLSELH